MALKGLKWLVLLISFVFFMGCVTATSSTPAYRYDSEMKRIAELYKKGEITESQKTEVVERGEAFWFSYHDSLDDLEMFLDYTRTLPR